MQGYRELDRFNATFRVSQRRGASNLRVKVRINSSHQLRPRRHTSPTWPFIQSPALSTPTGTPDVHFNEEVCKTGRTITASQPTLSPFPTRIAAHRRPGVSSRAQFCRRRRPRFRGSFSPAKAFAHSNSRARAAARRYRPNEFHMSRRRRFRRCPNPDQVLPLE